MTATPKTMTIKTPVRYDFNRMTPVWEWETERDEATFVRHGYWCEIKRHDTLKHLCGYVLIGKTHPYWGLNVDLEVHGGVTCDDGVRVGFDCAHAGDLVPSRHYLTAPYGMLNKSDEVYRNWAFVELQLDKLAKQLRDLDTRGNAMTQPDTTKDV